MLLAIVEYAERGLTVCKWRDPARCFSTRSRLPAKSLLGVALALAAMTAFLRPPITVAAPLTEIRRVLILNDLGGTSSPGFAEVDQAVVVVLQKSRYQIELYQESLELTLFSDEAAQRRIRQELLRRYSDRKPDLIVAAGTEAFKFLLESHAKFLDKTPIVFCVVLGDVPDQSKSGRHFTGVLGRVHPEDTLKLALHLLPKTKHVVVVGGLGKFDELWESAAKQSFRAYESKLEFTYLTDLTMPSLLDQLNRLPSNTIVYHTAITRDLAGSRFIDSAQSVPLVARAANAPVFVMDDVNLKAGTVGGDLVNWNDDARVATEMAVRILNGEKPEDIPIVASKHAYMFDWRALRRWGIKESELPSGSTVLFRETSVWERTKRIWLSGLLVIIFLAALAVYLQFSRRELKMARDAQLHLSGLLIDSQEKERSRLAAELHDDFSQRLALLSLGLENALDTLPDSAQDAKNQLSELMNLASEVGADLHTVSHHLHSSTLSSLGLAPGVRALCAEFTSLHGIQIDCDCEDVPRTVDPDTAVCLFRIVQEGLQNLKKHSGATKAQVILRKAGDNLFVSVSDEGRGFNAMAIGNNSGLGIRSMQERVRLFKGHFEIHSEPGRGTKIEAWVPLQPLRDPVSTPRSN